MSAAFTAALSVFCLGLVVRNAYELLKARDRVDTRSKRVFSTVFASMVAMWVGWFAMGPLAPQPVPEPAALRWTGLMVVALGTYLTIAGMIELRGVENIDHLVTSGVFSRIRHPMYTGFILWIVGWLGFRASLPAIASGLLGLASILWWRRLEEVELCSRYGEDYVDYRRTTWA